jgi:hypothetical protein
MKQEHVLSDTLFDQAQQELQAGNHWIAYNTVAYYLDKGDMYFFNNKLEAGQFAADNFSDVDDYKVIHASSIITLLRQLPYADDIHFQVSKVELDELFRQVDWRETMYDPLHDNIEAITEGEKNDLYRMETLLFGWEQLYQRDPASAKVLADQHWKGHPMESYQDDFITTKINTMNEKNLEAIKDNVKYLGFGETLHEQLHANIEAKAESFTLQHRATFNSKEIEATLNFKAGGQNEMYFFNNYQAKLEDKQQTFYLDRGNGITLKEAFNLLEGRAVNKDLVNKEGEKYNAWVQLDFENKETNGNYKLQRYHENFGYDLDRAVSKFPVKELHEEKSKDDLFKSLEKGNMQSVKIEVNGRDELHYLQADPRNFAVIVHDKTGQPLSKEQTESLKLPEKRDQKAEQKNEQKKEQSVSDEDGPELKKKRNRNQSKGMSV